MKLYINSSHQIKAVGNNDYTGEELTEVTLSDEEFAQFFKGYSNTLIKAFCYHKSTDENGSECLSVYPYKDFAIMEAFQDQYEQDQKLFNEHLETIVDNDYRLSVIELGLI